MLKEFFDAVTPSSAAVMSFFVLVIFMVGLYAVLFQVIPSENRDLANVMLGFAGGMATQVVSYFTGGTKGGATQTAQIVEMAKTTANPANMAAAATAAAVAAAAAANQPTEARNV